MNSLSTNLINLPYLQLNYEAEVSVCAGFPFGQDMVTWTVDGPNIPYVTLEDGCAVCRHMDIICIFGLHLLS